MNDDNLKEELADMTLEEQEEWMAIGFKQRNIVRRFAAGEVVRALPTPERDIK